MNCKERFLAALNGGVPDRLPVTTHHVMPYFLKRTMGIVDNEAFFVEFDLDPIVWTVPHRADASRGDYLSPDQGEPGFLASELIENETWKIREEIIAQGQYDTTRYFFDTPRGTLSMVLESNDQTSWVSEHLIKEKKDIDLIGKFITRPLCDVDTVNEVAVAWSQRGLVRGHICCFDIFGQPGCWQDACCLVGTQRMIMATFDDPDWVHVLLTILKERKLAFIRSLKGAHYDILELGGGDASTTVISPRLFREFVAPYDAELIEAAHEAGQRISYHTCGGMMPILEDIADMRPDAMETFTPVRMGGDVNLTEAKKRIGDKVCIIGGFDQFHFFTGCTIEDTKNEVRRCFEAAGSGGGYILCPSDHFFEADLDLIRAFSDAAKECRYEQY
jgi:uroporphyrinogen-III decarboxylase